MQLSWQSSLIWSPNILAVTGYTCIVAKRFPRSSQFFSLWPYLWSFVWRGSICKFLPCQQNPLHEQCPGGIEFLLSWHLEKLCSITHSVKAFWNQHPLLYPAQVNPKWHHEKGWDYPGLVFLWLPGLVSQSVLLWDGVRLEMKRIVKGHTRISLLPQEIMVNEAPLYASAR